MPDDHLAWGVGAVEESDRGDNPPEIFTPVGVVGKEDWGVASVETLGAGGLLGRMGVG